MDLYALPPEEFTAARDAEAKQVTGADKAALKALRRPTVSAWVVNTLVREDLGLVDQLLEVGTALGEAQDSGDAGSLRELSEQRRRLVDAVTSSAVDLVSREVSAAVRAEVAATLDAALVDRASGAAVRTGNLTRALSFAGFGGVDLDGAVADVPVRGAAPPTTQKRQPATRAAAVGEAERAAQHAAGDLDDAVHRSAAMTTAADAAAADLAGVQRDEQTADRLVADLHARLADATAERDRVRALRVDRERSARETAAARDEASDAVTAAQDRAEAARRSLDQLRRG